VEGGTPRGGGMSLFVLPLPSFSVIMAECTVFGGA